jgi:hypothetical protein
MGGLIEAAIDAAQGALIQKDKNMALDALRSIPTWFIFFFE